MPARLTLGMLCTALVALPILASAQDLTVEDVIERLKQNPIPTKYTADMKMDMSANGMPMVMDANAAYNEGRMKMKASMNMNGQPMFMTMHMDPEGLQWIETQMPSMNMTQIIKMDMAALMAEFGESTMFNMQGQSGMGFQPTPEMYDQWLEMMDMSYDGTESIDGQECYVLSGKFKDSWADEFDPQGTMREMGALPESVTYHFAKENSFPLRISMSSPASPNTTISMSNINLWPEFAEGEFDYTPPEDAPVMDMTEIMRQQMQAMRGTAPEIEPEN